MKKLLTLLLAIGLLIIPLASNATLWQYYQEQGQKLPSVTERIEIASIYGIFSYQGTAPQNILLESYLRSNSLELGSNVPVSGATWYLSSPISDTATTLTFSKVTDIRGNTLSVANLPTKIYFVIEPYNTSNTEIAVCPSSGYSSSDKQFTGCTRGLSFSGTSESAVTDNKKSHSSGSPVIMTNVGQFFNNFVDIDSDQTIAGNKIFASTTAPLDQRIGLGTTTPAYFTNNAGVLYYCNNGASCAAIGAGANTYNFIPPLGVSGSEVSLATSTYWFDLDTGNNLGIATTTGLGLSDFWNNKWLATSTIPELTISDKATTTKLVFSGDDDNQSMTSKFSRYYYSTTSHTLLSSFGVEEVIASTTLYNLEVGDTIKYRLWGSADASSGSGGGFVTVKFGGVTTTETLISSTGGANDFIWRGEILNINNEMQQFANIGIDQVGNDPVNASTTFGMLSGDTSKAINLYVQGVGPYNLFDNFYINGFTVEIIR